MKRLGVLVPSRGRPAQMLRLAGAVAKLSRSGSTDLLVGLDHDDILVPRYNAELAGRDGVYLIQGPREPMAVRTNSLWAEHADVYEYFASLGDDHLPRTEGWDTLLIDAIGRMGGTGFAYPDDKVMGPNLPTAIVMSADIPAVLGWMANPVMRHFCIDNTWKDLGSGAGCLAYCPEVVVEHLHWSASTAAFDLTYAEAGVFSPDGEDYAAYIGWKNNRAATDIASIGVLRERMVG